MSFKMNKLSAAVAATLGVAVVGISPAQADEILFPYIVTSNTVTTLVSSINNSDLGTVLGIPPVRALHYKYWYKNGANAENNTASCAEVDKALPSSANDVVTFDVSEQFGGNNLGILFEDTKVSTLPTGSGSGYGNASFALLKGLTQPVRAFLVVDNNDIAGVAARSDATLAGEAIVLEFENGAAWGYQAYNPAGRYTNAGARYNINDFSDYSETTGEVLAGETYAVNGTTYTQGFAPVAVAPFYEKGGEFLTKFFVTPIAPSVYSTTSGWLSPNQLSSTYLVNDTANVNQATVVAARAKGGPTVPTQLRGDLNARVRFAVQSVELGGTAAMYDRDETPVSGQVAQNVVCVGGVPASSMLTEGALLQVPDGGWSNLVVDNGNLNAAAATTTPPYIPTPEAIVIKLEYNVVAPLKLDNDKASPTVKGITNNAIWLRRGIRESIIPTLSPLGPRIQLSSVVGATSGLYSDVNIEAGANVTSQAF